MKHIYKLTWIVLLVAIIQSCKKDSGYLPSPPQDESFFIKTRQYVFLGKLADSSVVWRYSINNFQAGSSIIPLGGEQPHKSVTFDLLSNRDLSTRINIITPSYDALSDELFTKVLKEGEKKIGSKYDDFELEVTLNNTVYTTKGDQSNSLLKILKTESSKDDLNRDIALVWFKINCTLYSTVDSSSVTVKDGYLLACFMYNL